MSLNRSLATPWWSSLNLWLLSTRIFFLFDSRAWIWTTVGCSGQADVPNLSVYGCQHQLLWLPAVRLRVATRRANWREWRHGGHSVVASDWPFPARNILWFRGTPRGPATQVHGTLYTCMNLIMTFVRIILAILQSSNMVIYIDSLR